MIIEFKKKKIKKVYENLNKKNKKKTLVSRGDFF